MNLSLNSFSFDDKVDIQFIIEQFIHLHLAKKISGHGAIAKETNAYLIYIA